jgi:ATP-dependent Zn protease
LNPKFFRNGIVMLVLVVGTAALLFTWITTTNTPTSTGYSQFLQDVSQGEVAKVTQQGTTLTVQTNGKETYTVVVPTVLTPVYTDMQTAAKEGGHPLPADAFTATPAPDTSWLGLLLTAVLPLLIIGGFIFRRRARIIRPCPSARAALACSSATRPSSRSRTSPGSTRPRPSSRRSSSS